MRREKLWPLPLNRTALGAGYLAPHIAWQGCKATLYTADQAGGWQ